jgi:hypothetical protein
VAHDRVFGHRAREILKENRQVSRVLPRRTTTGLDGKKEEKILTHGAENEEFLFCSTSHGLLGFANIWSRTDPI